MIIIDNKEWYTAKEISKMTGIPVQTLIKRKNLIKNVKKMLKEYIFLKEEVISALIHDVK